MGTFVIDSSDDAILLTCNEHLDWLRDYHKSERFNDFTEEEKKRDLRDTYSNWLIRDVILLIEQEIIRHTIYDKMNCFHFFFENMKGQKAYIKKMQSVYGYYRKEVEKIMGECFISLYREAKKERNQKSLKKLKESNWTDYISAKYYLPFFYKDGNFRPLKKEQYDYNNESYNGDFVFKKEK